MQDANGVQENLFTAVRHAFGFLVDQYGFSPPRRVNTLSAFKVEFRSRRLIAKVLLEHRGGLLDFVVEKPPTLWNRVWGYPDRLRKPWLSFYATDLAESLGLEEFTWRPWSPPHEARHLTVAVSELARLVASSFGPVLRGDVSLEDIQMRQQARPSGEAEPK